MKIKFGKVAILCAAVFAVGAGGGIFSAKYIANGEETEQRQSSATRGENVVYEARNWTGTGISDGEKEDEILLSSAAKVKLNDTVNFNNGGDGISFAFALDGLSTDASAGWSFGMALSDGEYYGEGKLNGFSVTVRPNGSGYQVTVDYENGNTDLSSEFSVTEVTPGAGHNSGYDSIITLTSYIQEGELLTLYEKNTAEIGNVGDVENFGDMTLTFWSSDNFGEGNNVVLTNVDYAKHGDFYVHAAKSSVDEEGFLTVKTYDKQTTRLVSVSGYETNHIIGLEMSVIRADSEWDNNANRICMGVSGDYKPKTTDADASLWFMLKAANGNADAQGYQESFYAWNHFRNGGRCDSGYDSDYAFNYGAMTRLIDFMATPEGTDVYFDSSDYATRNMQFTNKKAKNLVDKEKAYVSVFIEIPETTNRTLPGIWTSTPEDPVRDSLMTEAKFRISAREAVSVSVDSVTAEKGKDVSVAVDFAPNITFDSLEVNGEFLSDEYFTYADGALTLKSVWTDTLTEATSVRLWTNVGIVTDFIVEPKSGEISFAESEKVYELVNGAGADVSFAYTVSGEAAIEEVREGDTVLTAEDAYTVTNTLLVFKGDWLKGLSEGIHTFTVTDNFGGIAELQVTVTVYAAPTASESEKNFEKGSAEDVEFSLVLDTRLSLKEVKSGDVVLDADAYSYDSDSGVLAVKSAWLEEQAAGDLTISVSDNKDQILVLTIKISEKAPDSGDSSDSGTSDDSLDSDTNDSSSASVGGNSSDSDAGTSVGTAGCGSVVTGIVSVAAVCTALVCLKKTWRRKDD